MTNEKILLAEYDGAESLLVAARAFRDAGVKDFDCYSPVPVHGMDEAMGIAPSRLGWVALGAGIATAVGYYGFLVFAANDYVINHSGKPAVAWEPFIPSTVMVTLIVVATSILLGLMHFCKLPRLYDLVFRSKSFLAKAQDDGFFLRVRVDGDASLASRCTDLFSRTGGRSVETLEEPAVPAKATEH